jgi:hypothetical protein
MQDYIDWSEAPDDATHAGRDWIGTRYFYKLDSKFGYDYFYYNPKDKDKRWHGNHGKPLAKTLIERPKIKATPEIDWSKAPERATHARKGVDKVVWYEWSGESDRSYWFSHGGAWYHGFGLPVDYHKLQERPQKEEKPMFKAMKFHVRNSKHSRQVQETLFSLGYRWKAHGQKPSLLKENFLFTDEKGYVYYGVMHMAAFDADPREENVMVARTTYSIEAAPKRKAKPETVELNGKTYLKADLEAALQKLTPVGGGK